ncbi:hypothetical protein [Nocardia salmonicida]|uniref:hypothetical protein n=1 Tax=Nocardia salmonicida TaxID=53431 RepID=UPI00207BBAF4|nr:hypothetical protein [Nocardia salmonicida]
MFGDEFTYDRDITELADELGQFGAQVRPAVVLARADFAAKQRHVQCGQLG